MQGEGCIESYPRELEVPRWRRVVAKGISAPEVLIYGNVAQWTCVAPSFMGHKNICKSQRTVMTCDCIVTDYGR
jgi:hypothetical protein